MDVLKNYFFEEFEFFENLERSVDRKLNNYNLLNIFLIKQNFKKINIKQSKNPDTIPKKRTFRITKKTHR